VNRPQQPVVTTNTQGKKQNDETYGDYASTAADDTRVDIQVDLKHAAKHAQRPLKPSVGCTLIYSGEPALRVVNRY
jgi:hypothetical protein